MYFFLCEGRGKMRTLGREKTQGKLFQSESVNSIQFKNNLLIPEAVVKVIYARGDREIIFCYVRYHLEINDHWVN